MSQKPILLLAHPRACSTAFERIFLHREDIACLHEPFDEAFFFGPERLHPRYQDREDARIASGYSEVTYGMVVERIKEYAKKDKRVFIKGMARVMMPYGGNPPSVAPSLLKYDEQANSNAYQYYDDSARIHIAAKRFHNPTVIPTPILEEFHFTFLMRHPRLSIPSFYRLSTPALSPITGFNGYKPQDAGYAELRRLFDYLRIIGVIGPRIAGRSNSDESVNKTDVEQVATEICLIDAEDLLEDAAGVTEAYCKSVGVEFNNDMLDWNSPRCRQEAEKEFGKKGFTLFHDEALASTTLKRVPKNPEEKLTIEDDYENWTKEFGVDGADLVRKTVEDNMEHYGYLKQFALKP